MYFRINQDVTSKSPNRKGKALPAKREASTTHKPPTNARQAALENDEDMTYYEMNGNELLSAKNDDYVDSLHYRINKNLKTQGGMQTI